MRAAGNLLLLSVAAVSLASACPCRAQVTLSKKIVATDGGFLDDFGEAVAIDGRLLLVGAPGDEDNGRDSGSAYLFDLVTGNQLAKLLPDDGSASEFFGRSVALGGGRAFVSSRSDDRGAASGSVYVFDVATGSQLAKLIPDDIVGGDVFGADLAYDNGLLLVGAPGDDDRAENAGAAYVLDAATGSSLGKLTAAYGALNDFFGTSVALQGGTALIGSPSRAPGGGVRSGSAFLFDVASGTELFELTSRHLSADSGLGRHVALDDGVALVGASSDDFNGINAGGAHLFDLTTGRETRRLIHSDASNYDNFGVVGLGGGLALVGSVWEDAVRDGTSHEEAGAAYVFDLASGTQLQRLGSDDQAAGDNFGLGVALSDEYAVVGATGDDGVRLVNGAVYVYRLGVPEPGDFDNDGDVDGNDFLYWQRDPSIGNLADWHANFGNTALSAAADAVPEPTSLAPVALAAAACISRRRKLFQLAPARIEKLLLERIAFS
jgi:hypothetical protein